MQGQHTQEFDLRLHRLSAIKKAAYRYSGHYQVQIDTVGEHHVRVQLSPIASGGPGLHRFVNEVLDQDLRELVAEETKQVRDLLLAQAFSGLSLVDPDGESADFRNDPLMIGEPSRGLDDVTR